MMCDCPAKVGWGGTNKKQLPPKRPLITSKRCIKNSPFFWWCITPRGVIRKGLLNDSKEKMKRKVVEVGSWKNSFSIIPFLSLGSSIVFSNDILNKYLKGFSLSSIHKLEWMDRIWLFKWMCFFSSPKNRQQNSKTHFDFCTKKTNHCTKKTNPHQIPPTSSKKSPTHFTPLETTITTSNPH